MTGFAHLRRSITALANLMSARERLVQRVLSDKRARASAADTYAEYPSVSLIVAAVNARIRVAPTVERIRATCADEVIVCEVSITREFDGEWPRKLTRRNEFLIRSTNGGEIVAYNRAFRLAKAPVICIAPIHGLQLINLAVIKGAMGMFGRHPTLAIIGNVAEAGRSDAEERAIESPTFFRRDVLLALNGFDEHVGSVDAAALAELCRRTRSLGWQIDHTSSPESP